MAQRASTEIATPPPGFARHFRSSRVTDPWEPIFSRIEGGAVCIGLRLGEAHCNSRGFVHGGVIATLADNALGLTYVRAIDPVAFDAYEAYERGRMAGETPEPAAPPATRNSAVTLSLTVDYAASAALGAWLQIEPRLVKAGRSIGFVDALVTADGDIVARASASFKRVG